MSASMPLDATGEAAWQVHQNRHDGKLAIRVLTPEAGLGVRDHELRAHHLDRITLFERHAQRRTAEQVTEPDRVGAST